MFVYVSLFLSTSNLYFFNLFTYCTVASAGTLPTLYPSTLRDAMEILHTKLKANLLNGVYRAGINLVRGNPGVAQAGREDVFAALHECDATLAKSRFLMGSELTAVDIRLAMTLREFLFIFNFNLYILLFFFFVLTRSTSSVRSPLPIPLFLCFIFYIFLHM